MFFSFQFVATLRAPGPLLSLEVFHPGTGCNRDRFDIQRKNVNLMSPEELLQEVDIPSKLRDQFCINDGRD